MATEETHNKPKASIIMAAYNRADVIQFAIKSILQSRFSDWELIIVGDGCTDQTEAVVASFKDPRISFENLPENSGGQAAPNNFGLEKAQGRYILFLNQDDMYLPDHIEQSINHLEQCGADVSWCPLFLVNSMGRNEGPPEVGVDNVTLDGIVDERGYDGSQFYLASSWVMRRSAMGIVGPWFSEDSSRSTPSQNWLFRAYQAGLKLSYRPTPTVLAIHAGRRKGSYLTDSPEHIRAWSWIANDTASIAELQLVTLTSQSSELYKCQKALRTHIDVKVANVADYFGVHRSELSHFLNGEDKGDFIRKIKSYTYDTPVLQIDKTIVAGSNEADMYLRGGWHAAEGSHRWSSTTSVSIQFLAATGDCNLHLALGTLKNRLAIQAQVNGAQVALDTFDSQGARVVPLGAEAGVKTVLLEVEECPSPKELGINHDDRPLGLCLSSFRLASSA